MPFIGNGAQLTALPASQLTGTTAVANGGTGTNSLTSNKLIVGNGTGAVIQPGNLHWDNTNSRLGIGTSNPLASLHIEGSLLIFPRGTATDPMTNVADLYGKPAGNYYVRWQNGTVSQNYWDGMWLKVHDEGMNANLFTSYWSDTTVTNMANFGGLGAGYGHGWTAASGGLTAAQNNTLTINNLPRHSFAKYFVRWHFVDSVDNELNQLRLYDIHNKDATEVFWNCNKVHNAAPIMTPYFSTTAAWSGVATYSYTPWSGTMNGYVSIDTNTLWHTTDSFRALHYSATDQIQLDEAIYYTHATLYIR